MASVAAVPSPASAGAGGDVCAAPVVVESPSETPRYGVVLFYRYTAIRDPEAFVEELRKMCEGLTGRILVAEEGINATLAAGSSEGDAAASLEKGKAAIDKFCADLTAHSAADFSGIDFKKSDASSEPFPNLLLKVVKEIISTGGTIPAPLEGSGIPIGKHLPPTEFHKKLEEIPADERVVIDVRCSKEYQIGHFDGAVNPMIRTFAEYPRFVQQNLDSMKGKQVFMYCTGGIRCEKASAYMRSQGFDQVFQLRGGIHRYMEQFPDGGMFKGRNFIFDKRTAMDPATGKREVVGRCIDCDEPFDELSGGIVCTVCRELVLVCTKCRQEMPEYYCELHRELKGLYFTILDEFTVEELEKQAAGLQALHDALIGDRQKKNRRQTLFKQINRVKARIEDLKSGAATPVPKGTAKRCRTCGEASCSGTCWGFWLDADKEETQQKRLEERKALAAKRKAEEREQLLANRKAKEARMEAAKKRRRVGEGAEEVEGAEGAAEGAAEGSASGVECDAVGSADPSASTGVEAM